MSSYNHFSSDNVALAGARDIGVFRNGDKVGRIPLGSLRQPNRERRLYSFGLISDDHIGENGADVNLRKALTYFANDKDVVFTVDCGDLVATSSSLETKKTWFQTYKSIVDECSNGKSVFAIGGNHEQWGHDGIGALMTEYVGNQSVWYVKDYGNDVFVFLGIQQYALYDGSDYQQYIQADIIAIHDVLKANRNKRCFIIQHMPIDGDTFEYNIFGEYDIGTLPLSLFRHYKNTTIFHGHTHSSFSGHLSDKGANVNRNEGIRSVHVPSLCDYCEGYVVDVYDDGIHLRGLNFETGYIPIASYWIDTALVDVSEEYTYKGDK